MRKLPKQNRVTSRQHISMLFQEGMSLSRYPFKVFYVKKKSAEFLNHKVLFAVSKKRIRSAVQRNRIKRLLREAYRINKYILDFSSDASGCKFVFLIGYVYNGSREVGDYSVFHRAVVSSLHYLGALLDQDKSL